MYKTMRMSRFIWYRPKHICLRMLFAPVWHSPIYWFMHIIVKVRKLI